MLDSFSHNNCLPGVDAKGALKRFDNLLALTAMVRAVIANSPQEEGRDGGGIDYGRFGILPPPAERGLSLLA